LLTADSTGSFLRDVIAGLDIRSPRDKSEDIFYTLLFLYDELRGGEGDIPLLRQAGKALFGRSRSGQKAVKTIAPSFGEGWVRH
jgi:hypothetical protein